MPSIGSSFFILGLVVASVTANGTPATNGSSTETSHNNTMYQGNIIASSVAPSTGTNISETTRIPTASTKRSTTAVIASSTVTPLTTKQSGNGSSGNDGQGSKTTVQDYTKSKTTPKPLSTTTRTTTTTKGNAGDQNTTPRSPQKEAGDSTGIIILIVIIIVALVFGVACYVSRKRGRRYSVDFTSRQDEANIPLSTVEPVETPPQNGLKTFENPDTATTEPQEQDAKPEEQVEQKAEADKSVVDPGAESAAPAPSPESTEDKPKEAAAEPSPPPAPVEPSVEDKTDDEGAVSSKTSVESLKETNENNSNNADFSQHRDLKSSNLFWDVPLNCPV